MGQLFFRAFIASATQFMREKIYCQNIGVNYTPFLTATWLSHGHLWAILKGTALLTQC